MKKLIFGLLFLSISMVVFCQPTDTTLPGTLTSLIAAFVANHVWVAYVVIAWGLLSEVLGSIPSIKANSTYQLIFGWIGWVIGLFKAKATN